MRAKKQNEQMFRHLLRTMYTAEDVQMLQFIAWEGLVISPDLKESVSTHHSDSGEQLTRLEDLLDDLGVSHRKVRDFRLRDVIGGKLDPRLRPSTHRDIQIVSALIKIDYFEMARYQILEKLAEGLGHERAADVFRECFDEEKSAVAMWAEFLGKSFAT